jgi:hypothetical protein
MKATFAVFIVLIALPARAEDMQKYLADTQEMVRQGKHQEALDRFIWFHEHALEHDPAMAGVRLSFALSSWKALGHVFPPANIALVELRDRTTKQVSGKGGNVLQFLDVAALNETFGEDSKTVDLFQTLGQIKPDLAKQCWIVAKDVVIKAKRFDLARKYIGNPEQEFILLKQAYDLLIPLYGDPQLGKHIKHDNEKRFVEESLQLITVALALHDLKGAKEVQEKSLAVVDDQRLRDAIPEPTTDALDNQTTQTKPAGGQSLSCKSSFARCRQFGFHATKRIPRNCRP